MRIDRVTIHHLRIPFRSTFAHSLKSRSEAETVIVTVTSNDRLTGIGEVLPRPYLSGETICDVLRQTLPELAANWLGRTFEDRAEVFVALQHERRRTQDALATLAGWELAVLDLAGRTFEFAVGDVIGPEVRTDLPGGVVIDFAVATDSLERHCRLLRVSDQRHVKVKVGHPGGEDLKRLDIIAGVFGPDFPLRLDANTAWTVTEATAALKAMQRFNIASVEQPVAKYDLAGLRAVRKATGVPVVVDESLCTRADAEHLIRLEAADIFNIRIAKCGGLLPSLELVHLAESAGLRCQLGTLVGETGVLSRAAEIFGRRVNHLDFLEGKGQSQKLLVEDIVTHSPRFQPNCPGLGLYIAPDVLSRWSVSTPVTFHQGGRA